MISTATPPKLREISEELLRFEHPEQWQTRPGWQQHIDLSEQNLARIVGGYNLAPDLYQHCGLCNTEHGRGFVVATIEGFETQIGNQCGARHLGAKFEELERLFTVSLDAQDRKKRLTDLVVQQPVLLRMAEQKMAECQAAFEKIAEIQKRIFKEESLAKVYRAALASEGAVRIQLKASEDEYEVTRQRFRDEVLGRIDGVSAATTKSPKSEIQATVLPLVHSLTEEMLQGLSGKALMAKSKEASTAMTLLDDATAYVALVKRFTSRKNWQSFASAFGPGRLKTSDRGHRVLVQLIDLGSE